MTSTTTVLVRYAETDKMGIVHHSVYPIWYEAARTDFSKQCGFSYTKMEETGVMMPLVELQCKFIRSATYDDTLLVKTNIQKLTPARIEFYYEVYQQGENTPINTGSTTHALVDKTMHPINVKRKFPELYHALEEASK